MGAVVSRERSRNRKRPVDNHNVTLYGFMMIYESTEKKRSVTRQASAATRGLGAKPKEWFRIELTYTSNAIEGNTLTRRETALVVEKGITVGGKSLAEHLEACNHAEALDWVKAQVKRKPQQISVHDMLHIHNLILRALTMLTQVISAAFLLEFRDRR